mmetsp:Transcript_3450/g.10882  ORF Transcript_3450/g.10882 Transcript_3450/m.10882 type:complete len:230 (-) Transcript_3450:689-1378(-)
MAVREVVAESGRSLTHARRAALRLSSLPLPSLLSSRLEHSSHASLRREASEQVGEHLRRWRLGPRMHRLQPDLRGSLSQLTSLRGGRRPSGGAPLWRRASGLPAVVHAAARLLASLFSLFSHPLGGSDLQPASTSAPPRVAPARSATAQSASAALPRRYVGCCPRLCCSPPLLPSPSEADPARSTPSSARSCRQCASPPPAAPAAALPAAPPSAAADACKASAPAQRCM